MRRPARDCRARPCIAQTADDRTKRAAHACVPPAWFFGASRRAGARQRLPLGIDRPISPTSVATTPPAISMIVFVEGDPVKKRATPSLIEWNDWPPKYSSTTPPTMSATEIARVMKILAETDDGDAAV
ncbi:conserved hypothetical protein [Burkholderia thailandensis E264]|uniref:Uncharacterized protein n=1 Tax=Burkholderia thailandensis (strain ATCC 700388 / DSM 13276 / CCUG 48851 / CIP 106301 / E264) TaxID=271848 RepID=Q2T264_BURTA|nr:conserved hypothetical protein [Burkholderia thailandensis E264]